MPFERKARFVTSKEMDEFYQKISNELEFRLASWPWKEKFSIIEETVR